MKEKYMSFGEFIKKKRNERELTQEQVGDHLNMTRGHISAIEGQRKAPFDEKDLKLFAEFLNLTEKETALMYDLASKYKGHVPHDVRGILLHEEVGELALTALRLSKECSEPEADWKRLIRELEKNKAKNTNFI